LWKHKGQSLQVVSAPSQGWSYAKTGRFVPATAAPAPEWTS
jgi:hypothetical protein